ncbi:hypothetical protein K438DRAFT_1753889 [Mycena galopus ATCC 62051]|nr:hypothetical protein K438DRAFT_1753889 [Mycena galopus ATCC 62051]
MQEISSNAYPSEMRSAGGRTGATHAHEATFAEPVWRKTQALATGERRPLRAERDQAPRHRLHGDEKAGCSRPTSCACRACTESGGRAQGHLVGHAQLVQQKVRGTCDELQIGGDMERRGGKGVEDTRGTSGQREPNIRAAVDKGAGKSKATAVRAGASGFAVPEDASVVLEDEGWELGYAAPRRRVVEVASGAANARERGVEVESKSRAGCRKVTMPQGGERGVELASPREGCRAATQSIAP